MDPRQFVKNSNVQIQRQGEPTIPSGVPSGQVSQLKIGQFKPGLYNVTINKSFTKEEQRVDLKYILKQRPRGHAQIGPSLSVDISEVKGIYGRFKTGLIHTRNFGMRGDLNAKFFSVQFSGYMTDGIERKNFSFNIYANGKVRFSGGFLGSKNLKRQPESLRKYIIDTYTEKQRFLYNDIEYNNVAGLFNLNTNFQLELIAQRNPLGAESVSYETEVSAPLVYMIYKGHNFALSSKSSKLGSGIVQIQGENDPDDLERAYLVGVEAVQELHRLGYTMGLTNREVNAIQPLPKLENKIVSTCPKPRRPPCSSGFEARKNPQGYECCYKIPKRKPSKKKTNTKTKNTKITYDKNGIMKIGGRKCERLTKPLLLEVARKLGVVGVKQRNTKEDICKALDSLEKGNSKFEIDGKLCRTLKKDQLISLAISKNISVSEQDTVKTLCEKLENKKNLPNSPNSLANEMEKFLMNKQKSPLKRKRRLNNASIKNDIIKLYGERWMKNYGQFMNINKDVKDIKNKMNSLKNKNAYVTKNGLLKKTAVDNLKRSMVKKWKFERKEAMRKKLLEKEANKLYGKFGKNVVNGVIRFVTSLEKPVPLNDRKVIGYIQTRRELNQKPPLPLNKKRVIPPKPKISRKPQSKPKMKRAPIKRKIKPSIVKRLNFNSNSNSNSSSRSRSNSKSRSRSRSVNNNKILNNLYKNFEAQMLKNKSKK